MKLTIFFTLLSLSFCLQAEEEVYVKDVDHSRTLTGSIEHVVRGDRVVFLSDEGKRFVVNLAFITSPESGSGVWVHDVPYAGAARTVIENRCMGNASGNTSISFSKGDSSHLHVGMLTCNGIDIGELLLMSGLVVLKEASEIPQRYIDAQVEAESNRFGVHYEGSQ